MYRREFLETSAASITGPLLGAGGPRRTATAGSENGRLVLIYDDAPIEDYETAFPVHEDLGVPANVAPVSTWVGTDGYCTADQLREMKNGAGFEVMSQTREHASLTAADIVRDVDPEDTKVYPDFDSHAYHPRYAVELTDGVRSVTRKVARSGEDDDGVFIKLADEVGHSFDAADPDVVERYPADTMRYILSHSQAQLRHMGFRADTLVAPYDRFSPYARSFARQYYDAVGNAVSGTDGLNDPANLDPFGLRRWYFIENGRRRDRFHRLDTIARENQLAVFGAHTYKEDVTSERIREVLRGAVDRGIEVVTLSEALRAYEAIEPSTPAASPAPTSTASTTTPPTPPGDGTGTAAKRPTSARSTAGDRPPNGSGATAAGDGVASGIDDEGLGAMAIVAGAGATLTGWHFLRRD